MTTYETIKTSFLLLSFSIVLMGCKDVSADDHELMQFLGVEKKYHLRDCIVKLNFLWDSATEQSIREGVFQEIHDLIKKATVSGKVPYFSGHTTHEMTYYVFYFFDQCEKRREYTRKLVEEEFLPNIPHFPSYEIEHEGIEPGFDGVTPSCCWLDSLLSQQSYRTAL